MASLLSVVDVAWRAAEAPGSVAVRAAAVRRALARYLESRPRALAAAAAATVRCLPPRVCCLTLSSSAVVEAALGAARRRGRLVRVVVAESRPGGEGRGVAERLAAAGIPVDLIADADVASWAEVASAVLVGADAVTPTGVWNKCGTRGAALAAGAAGRRFVVATTADRLVSGVLARRLRVPEMDVTSGGLRIVDRRFDVTSLSRVTRVVTEMGAETPAAIRVRLRKAVASGWWRT